MTGYLIVKWFHIMMAITALGANLTYGLWFTRAGREPQYFGFVLRTVRILDNRIANPAYGLLLLSGFAMTGMAHIPVRTPWVLTGLILWLVLVIIAAAGYTPTLRRGIEAFDAGGVTSPAFQQAAARGRTLGILLIIIAIVIVWIMVAKPGG